MARRHNNWGSSSYGLFSGGAVRSSSPDITWNRRGPFINLTEGSPAPYSANRYLLPEYMIDDELPGLAVLDAPPPMLTSMPYAAPDDLPVTPTNFVGEDEGVLFAPTPAAVAALSSGDEPTMAFAVEPDNSPAPQAPILWLVAALPAPIDEVLAPILEEISLALDAVLAATVAPPPVAEEEMAFAVEDEPLVPPFLPILQALPSLPVDDGAMAFAVEEEDAPVATAPLLRLVTADAAPVDEVLTPILEEIDRALDVALAAVAAVSVVVADEEVLPILLEEEAVDLLMARQALPVAPSVEEEELPGQPTPPTPTPRRLVVDQGAVGGPSGDYEYDPRFDEVKISATTAPVGLVASAAGVTLQATTARVTIRATTTVSSKDEGDPTE